MFLIATCYNICVLLHKSFLTYVAKYIIKFVSMGDSLFFVIYKLVEA